ncbi:MAG: ATP-dependent Clp protease proteolytic subunit [Actinobacteria bacterium]|nr:ATP-dependent Clp protease proteolytic subunit [Actinomycetota bacterium]
MGRGRRVALAVGVLSLWLAVSAATLAAAFQAGPTVATTTVSGVITPVIDDHLRDTVASAAAEGHEALIVTLDTPGGLVTSMRSIVQTFLAAEIPVVVHVAPRGADAGSAGTFITLAAHIAAMAPATTIGAATPVDLEGGEVGDKIVNNAAAYAEAIAEERGRNVEFAVDAVRDGRSITADEALEIGAIDLIAATTEELLEAIDGLTIELADGEVTLRTADAGLVPAELSGVRRLLQRLADPNLAFIFISLGTLAIIYEVANPGVGAGGIAGVILLILAFFSLSVLPVNLAGAALLVLAAVLFISELFVPGVGVMGGGGTIALILGGLFLFQRPTGIGVDLGVLVPVAVVTAALVVLIGRMAWRLRNAPSVAPGDLYLGHEITVERSEAGVGRARIDGTWWRLRRRSGLPLTPGEVVRVTDRDGLDLIVEPLGSIDPSDTQPIAKEQP